MLAQTLSDHLNYPTCAVHLLQSDRVNIIWAFEIWWKLYFLGMWIWCYSTSAAEVKTMIIIIHISQGRASAPISAPANQRNCLYLYECCQISWEKQANHHQTRHFHFIIWERSETWEDTWETSSPPHQKTHLTTTTICELLYRKESPKLLVISRLSNTDPYIPTRKGRGLNAERVVLNQEVGWTYLKLLI